MIFKKKIILLAGDPNSINSEIIYKSWKKLNKSLRKKIYVVANYELLKKQFNFLNYPINLKKINNFNDKIKDDCLKIINVELKFKKPFKVTTENAALYVRNCLNVGHKLALSGTVSGLINCPISKNLLQKKNYGVTEFLAEKCKLKISLKL